MNKLSLWLDVIINIGGPWLVYTLTVPHTTETHALMWSMLPPVLWALFELIRHKKLDGLSVLVLAGIGFSVAIALLGGQPEVMLMRESLLTGVLGAVLLLSLLAKRPLLFYLLRMVVSRQQPEGVAAFEQRYDEHPLWQRGIRSMTVVWGGAMLAETLIRFVLLHYLSHADFLWVSPILGYLVIGLIMVWTIRYRRRLFQA